MEFQKSYQEIPWDNIIGMRHKIVHDYMGMDEDIVWEVVSSDLENEQHWEGFPGQRREV